MLVNRKKKLGSYKPQSIGKVKKTKFFPVYERLPFPSKGKVNKRLSAAKGETGIYFIKEDGKLIYVGYSNGYLYKTITRHFQAGQDDRISNYNDDIFNKRYTVRFILTTKKQAEKWECMLIKKHKPRDNKNHCGKNKWRSKDFYKYKEIIRDAGEVPF